MKWLLILTALLWPWHFVLGQSAIPLSPSGSGALRIQNAGDLLKLLLVTTWTWEHEGVSDQEINFFGDGTAQHTSFHAKFKIKSPREVELNLDGQIAKLTFNPAYTGYTSQDFGNVRTVTGQRRNDPMPNYLNSPPIITGAQLRPLLPANVWGFSCPESHIRELRKFNEDGSWTAMTSNSHGTWTMQADKLLLTVSNHHAPEVYQFSPRTYEAATRKVHLEGTGSEKDAVNMEIADLSAPAESPTGAKAAYFGKKVP